MIKFYWIRNIFITLGVYCGLYYIKTGHFIPADNYRHLLPLYLIVYLTTSIYFRDETSRKANIKAHIYVSIYVLLILGFVLSVTDLKNFSRIFVISIVLIPMLVEISLGLLRKYQIAKLGVDYSHEDKKLFSYKRIFTSATILLFAQYLVLYIRYGSFKNYFLFEQLLYILLALWLVSGIITRKFLPVSSQNIYHKLTPFLKSYILMVLLAGLIYFLFTLNALSRKNLFGIILVFAIHEMSIFGFKFLRNLKYDKPNTKIITKTSKETQRNIIFEKSNEENDSILPILKNLSWFNNDNLVQYFVDEFKKLGFNKKGTKIYSTTEWVNFETITPQSLSLVMNMHPMNDCKNINLMLVAMSNTLKPGGMLVGCISPLEEDYSRLREKMPKLLFTMIYPIHFLTYRVCPKLPILRDIYEITTQGKGRYLSKAEIFGRLSYCGLSIVSSKIIDHQLYFIARKDKISAIESNPSYGPLIRLTRVGLNGELIKILKIRTMHPYSEFIQKDVFEKNKLDKSGKLKDDFRITTWGKVLRKYWIDELPQLVNWIRGEISLVGCRALSEHYFSLYPKDLQELRIQFKPGLIPPYYADMPKNFGEIIASERKYLISKIKRPISTDIIYFYKAFKNIVFKGARSQ